MDRRVRATKKDRNGNITALCNVGESWSPRSKGDVIKDISENKTSYYVQEVARRVYVRIGAGKGLVTTADETSADHLERLPSK